MITGVIMSATLNSVPGGKRISVYVTATLAFVLFALMAFDTKVISLAELEGEVGFSPQQFAQETFPEIQAYVEKNAVDASVLAPEVLQDAGAAGEKYGVAASIGHIVPVSLSGVAVESQGGTYTLDVADVPSDIAIRVQTGPAINGTTLRDTTGNIQFGDFTNQIEYQDVGAALNDEMKRQVLADISGQDLTGKTLEVVGSFTMINPKNWLITPVSIAIIE
jgi:predicted lipoprotein